MKKSIILGVIKIISTPSTVLIFQPAWRSQFLIIDNIVKIIKLYKKKKYILNFEYCDENV